MLGIMDSDRSEGASKLSIQMWWMGKERPTLELNFELGGVRFHPIKLVCHLILIYFNAFVFGISCPLSS